MARKKKEYTLENPHPDYKKRTDAVAVAVTGYDELCKLCKNPCKNPPIMVKCELFVPKNKQALENAKIVQRDKKRLSLNKFYKQPKEKV